MEEGTTNDASNLDIYDRDGLLLKSHTAALLNLTDESGLVPADVREAGQTRSASSMLGKPQLAWVDIEPNPGF